MKLHNAVQDQPIVSNVGQIGEFRIRNSAKAFSILSSGLYANKVRAIIRELSCNAIDSHTAAGKIDTPFDVHLPNPLEPHFSIRDYGTGLTHEQVTNIYTTYFESTKTNSNDFIGALGLGSKSPFSYTDNFTVTAVKDGRKGIYTAFINEQGVPSIALMMEEQTDEPSGVEVRFSVNDRYDFDKFKGEARKVYKWFKQRPVINGVTGFTFEDPTYETKDIIPGVHHLTDNIRNSYAVMGNISYPIEIPESDKSLDNLRTLLTCGLVMEFDIGELDFQASREGLSYIPETIASIKSKLEKLNAQLTIHLASEADKISNLWERALFLHTKHDQPLWSNSVIKYVTDTKFELYQPQRSRYDALKVFKFDMSELATKYNIVIKGFTKNKSYTTCSTIKSHSAYKDVNGNRVVYQEWRISISNDVYFVVNDTKFGASERSKYHWRNTQMKEYSNNVYIIEAFDKTKPIKSGKFFKALMTPPANKILLASKLLEKDRAKSMGRNVTIMRLEESERGRWGNRNKEYVWRDAGKADKFDNDETYYYIPLSGYQALNRWSDVKRLAQELNKSGVYKDDIYGVRKSDIEFIKTQSNWIELDKLIIEKLSKIDKENVMGLVKQALDINDLIKYNSNSINENSPFLKLVNMFKDVKAIDPHVQHATQLLCKAYDVQTSTSPQQLIDKYTKEVNDIKQRYPLVKNLGYSVDKADVAEYINLIDQTKGV